MRIGRSFSTDIEKTEEKVVLPSGNPRRTRVVGDMSLGTKIQRLPFSAEKRSERATGSAALSTAPSLQDRRCVEAMNALERANSSATLFLPHPWEPEDSPLNDLVDKGSQYAGEAYETQQQRFPNRSTIGPTDYTDETLKAYTWSSLRFALLAHPGHKDDENGNGVSPLIAATFLGCKNWEEIGRQSLRVLRLLGVPEQALITKGYVRPNDALYLTGFGPGGNHNYDPFPPDTSLRTLAPDPTRHMTPDDHIQHLLRMSDETLDGEHLMRRKTSSVYQGGRRSWLSYLDMDIDPPTYLVHYGAFAAEHRHRLRKIRMRAGWLTELLLSEGALEMGYPIGNWSLVQLSQKNFVEYSTHKRVDDLLFRKAVRRVFEEDWTGLDLLGPSHLKHDTEVMMARAIIRTLTGEAKVRRNRNLHIAPAQLLGMSILCGIPIAAFIQFGIQELRRKGESFLDSDSVGKIIHLIDLLMESEATLPPTMDAPGVEVSIAEHVSMINETWEILEAQRQELQVLELLTSYAPRKAWAIKLRSHKNLLWSHGVPNAWMIEKIDEDDNIHHTQKPDRALYGVTPGDRDLD